ncbi:ArsR/SmtB family transcription factor [Salinirubrum litoreum]|uniref:HTH arsR-type domain-containing protein n=1 Tax=Salinirubrum litoreum TaxID=1126234 RepID=A0ABD5R6C9_9EURY|nr:helix-turn-helix transcriptional regulator [Salinirubrum litoreum]
MDGNADTTFRSPLGRALSTPARVRIAGALVESRGEELLPTEIAGQAGVSERTFHNHREALVELGVMRKHHPESGYPRYTLADSPVADLLVALNAELDAQFVAGTDGVQTAVQNFTE